MGTEVDEGMMPVVVGCSPQPGREKYVDVGLWNAGDDWRKGRVTLLG